MSGTASSDQRGLAAARISGLAPGKLFGLLGDNRRRGALDLAVGTPSAPTTSPVAIEAACEAIRAGANQYDHPAGNLAIRRSIAASFVPAADPETEITVTLGATEGLAVALLALVDPGDEVIVLEPCYENFVSAIALAGARPRPVPTRAPEWRYDHAQLRAAFTSRTRAIILNSPANPSGHVLSSGELAEIAELCEKRNVTVISDEAYAAYVFDGISYASIADVPALRDRGVVIGTLSKSHAVSGWRVGFLRAAPEITRLLRQVHVAVGGAGVTPLQIAVARAAESDPSFWQPADTLAAQRDLATKVFGEAGYRCLPTEGGCYLMIDIRTVTREDSETHARRLAEQAGVLTAPGTCFFTGKGGENLLRVAFNRPVGLFDEVRRRLTAFSLSG
ncbi:pyridoxal phosphate-dependent aminotransferase [Amycolatopsis sp. NPDC004079]|uniref:pyridoxal phosphate-dependent aminotransferase n=1 Tax=Amycolatopsis sp. NPDC004079 TaxID=3154549 RepID=UPI0033B3DCE9